MNTSITNKQVFVALGNFLKSMFSCDVIIGEVNLVSMPQGSFILMNDVGKRRLSTNAHSYSSEGEMSVSTATEYRIQLDFYGADSGDMCQSFISLANDLYAYESFPERIKPLYTSEPMQIPLVTGEENFLEQWTTEIHLQINPTVTVPVTLIDELSVTIILANGESN